MSERSRVLSLIATLLFVGPLLAGLGGTSEVALPIFVAIFTLWLVIMRPAVWARVTREGTPVALAVHLAGVTLVQVILVMLCFVVGRGLSILIGAPLGLPGWLPVALSMAALPIGLLLRTPQAES